MDIFSNKTWPLVIVLVAFLAGTGESIFYRGSESYLSDVNLERFYLMEENVMSSADVLVREDFFGPQEEETEEEHMKHSMNVTGIESLLSKAKMLHKEVGPDLWNYLGHPINVLHLFRRLRNEWKKGLDLLLESTPCRRWKIGAMRRHLSFLKSNVPNNEDMKKMVNHLIRLQMMLGTSTKDVATGKVGHEYALARLTTNEQFEIGKILFEEEEMLLALPWFELVADWLKNEAASRDSQEIEFKESELLEFMSSAYYLTGQYEQALETTQKLLKLDPANQRVQTNLKFFKSKQGSSPSRSQKEDLKTTPGLTTRLERICARNVVKPSRKVCEFVPLYQKHSWCVVKKEVLRHNPPIALYHDVINRFTMEQLKEFTHEKLAVKSWISPSVFITPQMGLEIDYPSLPRIKRVRYAAQKMSQAFMGLPHPTNRLIVGWGSMQILNAGRSGIDLAEYTKELNLDAMPLEKGVGAMFAFLSEPKEGGEIVMRNGKIISPAPRGSILLYHADKLKLHSLCPALGGSQWVVVQPFYEKDPYECPRRSRHPERIVFTI